MLQRLGARLAVGLVAWLAFGLSACSQTVAAVNPRPTVVIEAELGKLAVDVSAVPDQQQPHPSVTITEFRRTLLAGFKNMAGANFTPEAKEAALLLRIEQAELSSAKLGNLGGFLIIRYRGSWHSADGSKIASFAGVAQPRNPTEPGPRHLEDVVEVMYEEMVHDLEKVQGVKTR